MSEQRVLHKTLAEALLAFQAEMPKPAKSATNPHFHSRFVPLDGLMDAAIPLLNKHDLVWLTLPSQTDDGRPTLKYKLVHAPTGETLGDEMPLSIGGQVTPQAQGSGLTFARRYSMMAMLGIVGDEDDDGHTASRPPRKQQAAPAAPPSSSLLTPEQRDRVVAAIDDVGANLPLLLAHVGAVSVDELTLQQARDIRARLDEMEEEAIRLANEALAGDITV